ncbi:unnamed protein product [Closterium sp. NIES-54]
MEAEDSAPAGPSGSGGVRGAGEAGRGVAGGSAPIASVSTPAKDDRSDGGGARTTTPCGEDQLRDLYVKLSAAGVDYPEKIKCYKALSLLPESWGPLVVNLNGMKDSWSLEWIRAQVLQEEFRRKELTAAAGEGGGSAYRMKGFKGRGSKKGKAKEGSGGEQYFAASYLTVGGLVSHQLKALRVFMELWEKAWAVRRAMEVPADMAACSTM